MALDLFRIWTKWLIVMITIRNASNQWFFLPSNLHFEFFSCPFDFVHHLFGTHFNFKLVTKKTRLFLFRLRFKFVPVRLFFRLLEYKVIIEIIFSKSVCRKISFINILIKLWKILSKVTESICLEVICLEFDSFVVWSRGRFSHRNLETKRIALFRNSLLNFSLRFTGRGCWERIEIKITEIIRVWLRVSLCHISKVSKRIILILLFLGNFAALVLIILKIFKTLIINSHLKFVDKVRNSGNPENMTFNDMSVVEVNVENADWRKKYLCSEYI